MQAGTLRRQVVIEQPSGAQNGLGEPAQSWSEVATVPAHIEPMGGREALVAGQLNAMSSYAIRLRFYPGLSTRMRVRYGDRVFEIVTVQNVDERNREIVLSCIEIATNAAAV